MIGATGVSLEVSLIFHIDIFIPWYDWVVILESPMFVSKLKILQIYSEPAYDITKQAS